MLEIRVPGLEYYDENRDLFIQVDPATLTLEHSLLSISKWESKWHKPYLTKEKKTGKEIVDYIRCMTLTQNVNPLIYNNLTEQNLQDILAYIEDPMTATTFTELTASKKNNQIITSELIYYWMLVYNIPFECQKWHINRLLTLVRVCNIKNEPKKNMPRQEWMNKQRELNAQRRAALNSKG